MRWVFTLVVCHLAISSCQGQVIGHTSVTVPNFSDDYLPHSTVMDPNGKIRVSWDFNKTHIAFEVTAQTLGYVGLGISPNGKMAESDIVIVWVDHDGWAHISDRFAKKPSPNESPEPAEDREQNVTLLWGHQNDTHTVVRFVRPREACYPDDISIKWGPVHLIWAYNDMDPVGNKIAYHANKRGAKVVFLLDPMKSEPYIPEDATTIELRNQDFEIPKEDYYLQCQSFAIPKLDYKHHVIKIEPLVESADVLYFRLFGCNNHKVESPSVNVSHKCYDPGMPQDWWDCTVDLFVWSNTDKPFYFPYNAGLPLGGKDGITMFLLETLYSNPEMKTGLIDSSGLRLTMTSHLRDHDAGMMTLGHVPSNTMIIPPYEDSFRLDGHCTKECLNEAMNETESITIFALSQHMHATGFKIRLRHFTYGKEHRPIAENEQYNYEYSSLRMLEQEVKVYSGDNLMTQCYYNTMDKTEVTWAGADLEKEEVCVSIVMYYPKIPLSTCMSSPHTPFLASFANATLDETHFTTITSPPALRDQDWTVLVKDVIDWSDASVRKRFQDFITEPHEWGNYAVCASGSVTHPSHAKLTIFPEIETTYRDETSCMVAGGNPLQGSVAAVFLIMLAVFGRFIQ